MLRTRFPFPILSDNALALTRAMRLPTFSWDVAPGRPAELIKRMAWYVERGVIRHVWYPVFPPDRNASDVLAWLRDRFASSAGDVTIVTDPSRMDLDAIHAMIAKTYWSTNVRRDVFEKAFHASIVVAAVEKSTGRTVAFARVVTDKATFAWLCDVVVDDAWHGRGIAKRLLMALDRMPEFATLRRWVLATRDAQSLYEQFGYRGVQGHWLERKNDPSAWQEPRTP